MFLAHGYHDAHIKNLREIYSQRWYIMKEGLKQHLPMFSPGPADGGTSFWLTGPDHFNAEIFAKCLQERGVLIEPGHIFYKDAEHKKIYNLLSFCSQKQNKRWTEADCRGRKIIPRLNCASV